MIEQGMTNAEIGAQLFIAPKAVEYHPGNIYAKFGFKRAATAPLFRARATVKFG